MLFNRVLLCISPLAASAAAAVIEARASDASQVSSLVNLGYAKYQGTSLAAGVTQWLGMRFAAPPLGNLRWRAPADPVVNDTVQDASQFGPVCTGPFGSALGDGTAEDCLFVNVFTPSNATTSSKLPVWVYIQGGGYAGNTNANYNGTNVIQKSNHGLVFVNFNYRVGAFGFLSSENVQKDGDLNVGLLDQRKLLQWVQQYIHLFGGDPNHVVIHGASAGAGSIAYHLTAYGGRNDHLFVGGMSESPFFPTHRTVAESEFQFARFAQNLSCSHQTDVMSCLRSKSTQELAQADVVLPFPGATGNPDWYWLPCVDGNFSQELLYTALDQGKIVKVPVVVGNDLDEGNGFAANAATNQQFLDFMVDNYPKLTAQEIEQINKTYPLMPPLPLHAAWFPSAALAYGDSTFTCPGNEIAASVAKYFSPDRSWNYLYNVTDNQDASIGDAVPHTAETIPIFGVGYSASCDNCSYESYNAPIIPIVMDYWISFVKYLDPNVAKDPSAPTWEPWGEDNGQRLQFILNTTHNEAVPADQQARCAMWKSFATTIEQ